MTEFKLVPVEPTEEMLAEGATVVLEGISRTTARWVYEAMLAAAPAVQVEPVGYVSPRLLDALRSGKACGITMEDKPDVHNGVTIPLYTAECGCCGQMYRCDDDCDATCRQQGG